MPEQNKRNPGKMFPRNTAQLTDVFTDRVPSVLFGKPAQRTVVGRGFPVPQMILGKDGDSGFCQLFGKGQITVDMLGNSVDNLKNQPWLCRINAECVYPAFSVG